MGAIIVVAVIALVAILVVWGISVQRNLVHLDELTGNALSQIGVQQQSRWDALTALAEMTKGYSEHEYRTLQEVIAQRQPITARSTAGQVNAQESMITEALGRISFIAEQYPDLKAQALYTQTMGEINNYEQQVRVSRMTYNDTITKFNRAVRQFPASLVAGMLGFSPREYLEVGKDKDVMPSMAI